MSTTAARRTLLTYSGDVDGVQQLDAADNTDSPGSVEIKTLANGANTITPPTGGTTPTAVTIVPPTDNETSITLKGVTGDTGVRLHNTDHTTIALNSGATFVLTAGAEIVGVRLYWS